MLTQNKILKDVMAAAVTRPTAQQAKDEFFPYPSAVTRISREVT